MVWRDEKQKWEQTFKEDWEKSALALAGKERIEDGELRGHQKKQKNRCQIGKMWLSRKQTPNLHMNSPWKSRGDHSCNSAICHSLGGLLPSLWHLQDSDTYCTDMLTLQHGTWWIRGKLHFSMNPHESLFNKWWKEIQCCLYPRRTLCFWNKVIKWEQWARLLLGDDVSLLVGEANVWGDRCRFVLQLRPLGCSPARLLTLHFS